MTTYYSSGQGWTPGQDISTEFPAFVSGTLIANDTLVLEEMFQLDGTNIQLPDGFTLSATKDSGIDLINTSANSNAALLFGDNSTIDNVTFTASESPDTGYVGNNAQSGTDHDIKVAIELTGSGFTILNCHFSDWPDSWLEFLNATNVTIDNTYFGGADTQVRLHGNCTDIVITNCHFYKSMADAIKTISSGGYGTQRVDIVDTLFEDANRDAVDTTGGFKDSTISNCVLWGNGLDFKQFLEVAGDVSDDMRNEDILVEDTHFVNSWNVITVTMLDNVPGGVLTDLNADDLMPHHITFTDCVVDTSGGKIFLLKDGHNITWSGMEYYDTATEVDIRNESSPAPWVMHDIGGTSTVDSPTSNGWVVGDLWSGIVGPVGATSQTAPQRQNMSLGLHL